MSFYTIKRLPPSLPAPPMLWDGPGWRDAAELTISQFLRESSDHRPVVRVKLLYDRLFVRVLFRVSDRYVRCTRTGYLSDVWNDSCVEWFVQPKPDKGYFAFEVNCGGALNALYVEDPARIAGNRLKKCTPLPPELADAVGRDHSMPAIVDPEIEKPVEWHIALKVPIAVLEHFVGPVGDLPGRQWRANFNKCADQTSHPHWATWAPLGEKNFHRPHEFGTIEFEAGENMAAGYRP